MGVLNITPDSFSDGGRYLDPEAALDRALQIEAEGADLIDIGGESSRPGSDSVSVEEELRRVLPALKKIAAKVSLPISIDTNKALVAETCLKEGAALVNDISAMTLDPEMPRVVRDLEVPVVLMHMRGRPKTMQTDVSYHDVVAEVRDYLQGRVASLVNFGIPKGRLILDPGIGFGKELDHNLQLITGIGTLSKIGCPLLIGTSRKSFIFKALGSKLDERLEGSLATAAIACYQGARIARAHDVAATVKVLKMVEALLGVN